VCDTFLVIAEPPASAAFRANYAHQAMFPTFKHDIPVFIADKQVDPVNYGKGYKIKLVLVVEFVFAAHGALKIQFLPAIMLKTRTMA